MYLSAYSWESCSFSKPNLEPYSTYPEEILHHHPTACVLVLHPQKPWWLRSAHSWAKENGIHSKMSAQEVSPREGHRSVMQVCRPELLHSDWENRSFISLLPLILCFSLLFLCHYNDNQSSPKQPFWVCILSMYFNIVVVNKLVR